MIHFNSDTRTFNLVLYNSYYAFQVDPAERVVHLGWGPRPAGASPDDVIRGEATPITYDLTASFITQFRPDEVLTFGDVTSYQVTLKANFPTLPQPLQSGEDLHLPIRDLRLRYVGHEVVTNARPGLAPTHGLPLKNSTVRETLRVRLKDPVQNFFAILCYRLAPEHDIIERWLELE
ncbi:MAG: glycoside hydrolase family 36 N-terminal domain-containing protein, partial [Anaerolineae bacterium]